MTKVIQVSDNGWGEELTVDLITQDGEIEHDSAHKSKAAAEKRAAQLAKICGCEWETNY